MRRNHLQYGFVLTALLGMVLLGAGGGCSEDDTLRVTDLSKKSGLADDNLTIYGSGFQKEGRTARVFFGDKKARVLGFKGNDQLVVKIPGGYEPGTTVDIKVVFEPGGVHTYKQAFTYIEEQKSTVDDLLGEPKKKE